MMFRDQGENRKWSEVKEGRALPLLGVTDSRVWVHGVWGRGLRASHGARSTSMASAKNYNHNNVRGGSSALQGGRVNA